MSLHPGLREVDLDLTPSPPVDAPVDYDDDIIPAGRRWRDLGASIGWGLVGFAVLIGVWALGAWRVKDLPSPADTFSQLRTLLGDAFHDGGPDDKGVAIRLFISLKTVGYGFALAALVGVPFGLMVGASRRVFRAANPVIQLLRPVSPLAWFPVWLIVFKDSGQAAKYVIFMTSLWPVVINTAAGAGSIPADHRNVARVFQFSRLSYLRHVLIPHSLPSIVTGLRLSMGIAWMVIVAVEMMSTSSGIGGWVWVSYNGDSLTNVMCAVVLIGACGLVLDLLFLRLAKLVAPEEVKP